MVRVGAVRAGSDDHECRFRMPLGHNGVGDIGGHVGLGAARREELWHPGVNAVDSGTGEAQHGDLSGVLHHPQPRQHPGGEHGNDAQHIGQWQQVQRRHRIGDRGRDRAAPEHISNTSVRVLAVDPVPHHQAEIGRS